MGGRQRAQASSKQGGVPCAALLKRTFDIEGYGDGEPLRLLECDLCLAQVNRLDRHATDAVVESTRLALLIRNCHALDLFLQLGNKRREHEVRKFLARL